MSQSLPGTSGLLTDHYQLTMLDAYLARDMRDEAVFEFFVRRLPGCRSFLMAAGLEQLLDYLERLSFTTAEIEWLASSGRFSAKLIDYLADFRFCGEVRAMAEGTVVFENEPLVQVIASLPEAQFIETRLINLLHFQTMIASKAARSVLARPGKLLVDFGLRRAHGAEAGLLAARATYIAGFSGTATVQAGAQFGIPTYGTMAHSFVQAHDAEIDALEHFARCFPDQTILLIDTYDPLEAAAAVADLAVRLREEGIRIGGVRIDSGDLAKVAAGVRHVLDANGCEELVIFASGNLDEYELCDEFQDAPIDGYGIGTRLDVSADAPYLDCAYKLQEYAGRPRRKISPGKETWPGRKQVFRCRDKRGRVLGDVIAAEDDAQDGEPLLQPMMRNGRRLSPSPSLEAVRERAANELESLPEALRGVRGTAAYPVKIAESLERLAAEIDRGLR